MDHWHLYAEYTSTATHAYHFHMSFHRSSFMFKWLPRT